MFFIPLFGIIAKLKICILIVKKRPLPHIAALPDDGRNYRPKHVVNVMEKWIYNHL